MQNELIHPLSVRDAGVTKGDYFVAAWGYGQTNIDYWQVVGFTSSGKSVKVRRCQTVIHSTSDDGHTDTVYPGAQVGEPVTKRIKYFESMHPQSEGGGEYLVPWFSDGRGVGMPTPQWVGSGIFPTHRQTNPLFGH